MRVNSNSTNNKNNNNNKNRNNQPEVITIGELLNVLDSHVVVQGDQVGPVVHVQHARLDVLNNLIHQDLMV